MIVVDFDDLVFYASIGNLSSYWVQQLLFSAAKLDLALSRYPARPTLTFCLPRLAATNKPLHRKHQISPAETCLGLSVWGSWAVQNTYMQQTINTSQKD